MRFLPTEEQQAFADAVDEIVDGLGGTDIPQAWSAGDTAPGLALWQQFAELGLGGLRIAEDDGGLGGSAVDLAVVFERLGYHAVPGPYLESIALLPRLVDDGTRAELAAGAIATAAVDGVAPYAQDADAAALRFAIDAGSIAPAEAGARIDSLSGLRRLSPLTASGARTSLEAAALGAALDEATLAASALLLGAGERLLLEAVEYAKIREQFGRPIGEYQALKHQLADVRVALSFARPLVHAAALAIDAPTAGRDVSAAKVAAGAAARGAARTSLQVHGAIGYTAEHPVGLWIALAPVLDAAWGTPTFHRARVARALTRA